MIKNPQAGERVTLPDGTRAVIKQVYRERRDDHCGRVSVLTSDNKWWMAWDLRRPEGKEA